MTDKIPPSRDDIQAYADDALSPERRAEVRLQLEADPDSARLVERIVAQNAALRAVSAALLDEKVPPQLQIARLFERDDYRAHGARGARRASPWLAAAAVAFLMIGGATGWSLHPESGLVAAGVRPLVDEATDAYAVYEPDRLHPIEVSSADRHELMRWVTSRLRRDVAAPDTIADYRLLGGRVVATSRGPAAMFMYEDEHGKRIVMMICPLSLHGTAPITTSKRGDIAGVSWSDHGIGYSLVSTASLEDLRALGTAVRHGTSDKA